MAQNSDKHSHILIIEDDADINDIIATYLEKRGFSCTQAYSGSEAKLVLELAKRQGEIREELGKVEAVPDQKKNLFDLVITDLMLPGLSGKELVNLVREKSDVPIMVISAQDTPTDKLELFNLGVDDYLVKPFDLDELFARVMVQLRHLNRILQAEEGLSDTAGKETTSSRTFSGKVGANTSLIYRDWVLNSESRQFSAAGRKIKLTRTEFDILEILARRPSKVYTKQELFEMVWQEEAFTEEKAINVHISNIRNKLKPTGTDNYIETVWGIGFKLEENLK